ncbi:hypothetical protein Tco_1455971 [Tanacetum coccineum]
MELFCFIDEVFDSECVQAQVTVQQVQNWKHVRYQAPFELHVDTTSKIFDCFRNADVNYFTSNTVVHTDMMQDAVTQELFGSRSGSTPHGDILRTYVCQSALPTLNHAYLCLYSNGCGIRPEVISFPNRTEETRRQRHLPTEYLGDHAQIAQHEGDTPSYMDLVTYTTQTSTGLSKILKGYTYECVLIDANKCDVDVVEFLHQVLTHWPQLSIIVKRKTRTSDAVLARSLQTKWGLNLSVWLDRPEPIVLQEPTKCFLNCTTSLVIDTGEEERTYYFCRKGETLKTDLRLHSFMVGAILSHKRMLQQRVMSSCYLLRYYVVFGSPIL